MKITAACLPRLPWTSARRTPSPRPYQLDARACLSYLTIEHAGPIEERYRAALGNRVYGCDDCLAACPWNKFASESREAALHAREALQSPSLAELAALDDAAFRAFFAKSPIKRIGLARFVRNVLYAIGNIERSRPDPGSQSAAGKTRTGRCGMPRSGRSAGEAPRSTGP